MKKSIVLLLTAIAIAFPLFSALPANATQLRGEVSNGYYWLLTDNNRWQCRSTTSGRIQKHQKCIDAGAVKPSR